MAGLRNQLSYSVVNEMVYSGLAHMINNFRRDVLQLPALRVADRGAAMLETQQARLVIGCCTNLWCCMLPAAVCVWSTHCLYVRVSSLSDQPAGCCY